MLAVSSLVSIPFQAFTSSGNVHNIKVEEDESYVTVGGTVHNCRWFGVPHGKSSIYLGPHFAYQLRRRFLLKLGQNG
jgi:hypothetical protein